MSAQFPDVEAMVVAYLAPLLGVPVRTRVPDPVPETFLQIMRTGGPAQNRVVENAQVTFVAWSKALPSPEITAMNLARQARQLMFDGAVNTGMPLVRQVQEFAGIYADDDPETNIPRYTFTMALRIRAPRS